MAKQQQAEEERKNKAVSLAERRLALMEQAATTERETRARLVSERMKRVELQELERRGLGNDASIQRVAGQEAMGAFMGGAKAGGVGGMAAAAAGGAAATARKNENQRALDAVFEGLSPELRDRVIQEGRLAQQERSMDAYAATLLKKVRMLDRAEDVLPGHDDVLGPMADQIEKMLQSGDAATPQGQQALQQIEQQVQNLQQENMNDQMRKVRADTLEQGMMTMAAGNPFLTATAAGIALANRNGFYETADDAWGDWLVEWNPGAFKAGLKKTVESQVREEVMKLRAAAASKLTTTDSITGKRNPPTADEIDEYVALVYTDEDAAMSLAHSKADAAAVQGKAADKMAEFDKLRHDRKLDVYATKLPGAGESWKTLSQGKRKELVQRIVVGEDPQQVFASFNVNPDDAPPRVIELLAEWLGSQRR